MSFFSVHGYYDEDFILESGTFDTNNEAQELCSFLNDSNNSPNIKYVVIRSQEYSEQSNTARSNIEQSNTELNDRTKGQTKPNTFTKQHIFFDDNYDLVTDYYLDGTDSLDAHASSESETAQYDYLDSVVIKKYGVGYVFDCQKDIIETFVNNNLHIKIYYLEHIKRYFFRKSQMDKILEIYNFKASDVKIPFPSHLWNITLSINRNDKTVTCNPDYGINDYYFLGGFKNASKPNTWNFKPNAFNKLLKYRN